MSHAIPTDIAENIGLILQAAEDGRPAPPVAPIIALVGGFFADIRRIADALQTLATAGRYSLVPPTPLTPPDFTVTS